MPTQSLFHVRNETDIGSDTGAGSDPDAGSLSARAAARLATQAAARYFDRAHAFRFEPFRSLDQFLILCFIISVCLFALYNWRFVIKCCLGDDKIRIDRFQFLYWTLFQCCGCCDGEWTRCISSRCCGCLPRLKGRNLKRMLGENLGLYPVAVRLQNIVVGGLPQDRYSWFPRSPDLFVQVIPDETSPTLNTEVITEANTECAQFTSSLTMLVKNNASDDPVRFIVKQMKLTGSKEVADCSVNPAQLICWAQNSRKCRIQMGGACRRDDPLCMPWILLDLSIPPESKYLRKEVGAFNPIVSTSVERGLDVELDDDPTVSLFCGHSEQKGSAYLPITTEQGFVAIHDASIFMDSYPLVNDKGAEVKEDRDMAAQALLNTRSCANLLACWALGLFLLFILLRIFTSGCLEEYKELEAMRLYSEKRNVPFDPLSVPLIRAISRLCNFQMLNLQIFEHIIHADARQQEIHDQCFPPLSYARCATIRNTTTPGMLGLPCPARACSFDYSLEDHDLLIVVILVLLLFGICLRKLWETHTLQQELIVRPSRKSSQLSLTPSTSSRRASLSRAGVGVGMH